MDLFIAGKITFYEAYFDINIASTALFMFAKCIFLILLLFYITV